jgi:hypothetical protein
MTTLDTLRKLAQAATPKSWTAAMLALSSAMECDDSIVVLTREQLLAMLAVIEAAKAIDYEMFNGMTPSVASANKLKSALAALEGDK